MSDFLRVAFVVEGKTDFAVLRAAVRALLGGRDFEAVILQPECDESLLTAGAGGWGGVYRWCRQAVAQAAGPARNNPLFSFHDVVVVQLDADVAGKKYSDYEFRDAPSDLPFKLPCPPTAATTDRLRRVLLGWLSESSHPCRLV